MTLEFIHKGLIILFADCCFGVIKHFDIHPLFVSDSPAVISSSQTEFKSEEVNSVSLHVFKNNNFF